MTAETTAKIEAFGSSHAGVVRENNQDSLRSCSPHEMHSAHGPLYAIADGMGGYEHGEIASSLGLETLFDSLYSSKTVAPAQNLKHAIQNANLNIYQTAQKMQMVRMGTTLTAVNVVGNQLHVAHVGDSRAYLIRDKKAVCLTNDHTMVGDLVRMKVLSPDKVRNHNQRSVLNKCLGIDMFVQPDVFQVPVQAGDTLILCTDGAWSMIEDHEFADLTTQIVDPEKLCQHIIDLAMERESDDNVSALTIHVRQLAGAADPVRAARSLNLPGFIRARFQNKS
jgi:serine/threonine protein phosphatase PrpC